MKFKYNGKIYNPINLEKKLKKLGITIDDIELIEEPKNTNENTYSSNSTLYYFKKDDYVRCNIYPEENGWEKITREEYNSHNFK